MMSQPTKTVAARGRLRLRHSYGPVLGCLQYCCSHVLTAFVWAILPLAPHSRLLSFDCEDQYLWLMLLCACYDSGRLRCIDGVCAMVFLDANIMFKGWGGCSM